MHALSPCEDPFESFQNSIQNPLGVLCIGTYIHVCIEWLNIPFPWFVNWSIYLIYCKILNFEVFWIRIRSLKGSGVVEPDAQGCADFAHPFLGTHKWFAKSVLIRLFCPCRIEGYSQNLWLAKKLSVNRKSTFLIQLSWYLKNITYSWGNYFDPVS